MFRIRTIPLAFRRVSVCVCLVGFASLQSPWAHTLKASLPCVPLPLHRTSLFPQPSQKHINRFVPHHALASLVKGRWLDGKAQALILLLSVCDTPTFSIYQTFLPSRRRDCLTTIPRLHQPSQTRTITLAFRRVSVCVCLVGFASLQSPWAHTLKASLPLYERSVGFASCKAFGRSFQASLPCLPLPLHRTSLFPQPSQKHINRFAPH